MENGVVSWDTAATGASSTTGLVFEHLFGTLTCFKWQSQLVVNARFWAWRSSTIPRISGLSWELALKTATKPAAEQETQELQITGMDPTANALGSGLACPQMRYASKSWMTLSLHVQLQRHVAYFGRQLYQFGRCHKHRQEHAFWFWHIFRWEWVF